MKSPHNKRIWTKIHAIKNDVGGVVSKIIYVSQEMYDRTNYIISFLFWPT